MWWILKESFPELFHIARDKEALVVDHMQLRNNLVHWDLNFICTVQDTELESISSIFFIIYFSTVQGHGANKLCWNRQVGKGSGYSYYKNSANSGTGNFPWKSIWKPRVPTRATSLLRLHSLGKY